jgi:hypothetical protein
MSLYYNRDGSVTMISDADPGITQTLPLGSTQAAVDAAYAAFLAANPAPQQTLYAPTDFIDLFTAAEQALIVAALPGNAPLFIWYSKMLAAPQIDVTSSDTVTAVNALAAAGLITQARAAEILGSG